VKSHQSRYSWVTLVKTEFSKASEADGLMNNDEHNNKVSAEDCRAFQMQKKTFFQPLFQIDLFG